MNLISIIILIVIVVAAIFLLTYVAHDRGSSMCAGCHGDCSRCEGKKRVEQKDKREQDEE